MEKDFSIDFEAIQRKYNLNEDQTNSFRVLINNDMTFLTGEAGTGKSYLLSSYIDYIENLGGTVMVTAPTGIAAVLLNGATLHRTFRIPIPIEDSSYSVRKVRGILKRNNKALLESLECTDVLIIDEISMCRIDVFEYVMNLIKVFNDDNPKNKVRVVLCGDFLQLPPVITSLEAELFKANRKSMDVYPFQSDMWEKMEFKTTELKTVVRQSGDNEFIENLNKARLGDDSCIPYFNQFVGKKLEGNAIMVSGTNKTVNSINEKRNSELDADAKVYKSSSIGDIKKNEMPTSEKLELKIGTRVMSIVNDYPFLRYSNGSLGTVIALDEKSVKVDFDSCPYPITIETHTWDIVKYEVVDDIENKKKKLVQKVIGTYEQLPLKLAFAVTIHKSQGQTYEKVVVSPFSWDCGQLYVALSRCKSADGLSLEYPVMPHYLKASEEVLEFLRNNTVLEPSKELSESGKEFLSKIYKPPEEREDGDDDNVSVFDKKFVDKLLEEKKGLDPNIEIYSLKARIKDIESERDEALKENEDLKAELEKIKAELAKKNNPNPYARKKSTKKTSSTNKSRKDKK